MPKVSAPPLPREDEEALITCSNCFRVNSGEARFCDWCGTKPVPYTSYLSCSRCNGNNQPYSKFCSSCACHIDAPPRTRYASYNRKKSSSVIVFQFTKFIYLFIHLSHTLNIYIRRDITITITRKCCDRRRKQKLNSN